MRKRRTKLEMDYLKCRIYYIMKEDLPMTCRQIFYRMVSEGIIDKTENEYKNTTCKLLSKMRRNGEIPYGWVSDNTRWIMKPSSYSNLKNMLLESAKCYRKSIWMDLNINVEIWLEKDALSGVIYQETESWDVPLMVTRGYPSLTFLYGAGEHIRNSQKPTYIYYFGDYDPSGVDIPRFVEKSLKEFAPSSEIIFEILAVTGEEQIRELNLITRPTKMSDSRSKNFTGESVEVDAIPSKILREMANEVISNHVPIEHIMKTKEVEKLERETLMEIAPYIDGY